MVEYPNVIRNKTNRKILKETINAYGYVVVSLNSYPYKKHRLIAMQFIPNPNNFSQVDHINHIKTDNRIENLRWCNNSINNRNRLSYNGVEAQYVDELPENV
ncbi:HNH endonuclease signature motif containing protein, partial [uncultured Brachyspira sp.]|uniref:HNH endonuclease signature motif containing protein n=1 Tax=uncultured Brachyspira sp. TaxID=221953 RepID=UPI0025D79798